MPCFRHPRAGALCIKIGKDIFAMVLETFIEHDLPFRRSREGGSPSELAHPLRISLDSRLRGNDGEGTLARLNICSLTSNHTSHA